MLNKLPAYTIYLILRCGVGLFFAMMSMISAIYRVQSAGLDPLQLILVGTALESAVFLFEVPTGIVADIYSRRASVIIGYALIGLGFMLEGAFALFPTILLAQVIWGFGYTFTSGAEAAWLADEIGEERLTGAYLRASQIGRIGTLAGIALSVGLGTISLALPIFLGGVGFIGLALFLILFMPETGFNPTPMPERNSWQKMTATFADGVRTVRGRPLLIIMMAIAVIYGLSSEGLDRLWEAHILANFTFPTVVELRPVVWFGLINVAELFLTLGATELVRRRVSVEHQATAVRTLLVFNGLVVAGLISYGLAGNFPMAVGTFLATSTLRGTNSPLYHAWLNKGLKSEVRATVLSMNGQLDAIGQIAGGPIIGLVAVQFGLRAAMVGVALMLLPAVVLYGRALRHISPDLERELAG